MSVQSQYTQWLMELTSQRSDMRGIVNEIGKRKIITRKLKADPDPTILAMAGALAYRGTYDFGCVPGQPGGQILGVIVRDHVFMKTPLAPNFPELADGDMVSILVDGVIWCPVWGPAQQMGFQLNHFENFGIITTLPVGPGGPGLGNIVQSNCFLAEDMPFDDDCTPVRIVGK